VIDSKHWAAVPAHNMWGKDPFKHKCMPALDTTSCVHLLFLLMFVCHRNVTILVSQRGKPVQVLCPGGDYDVTVSHLVTRSSCFIHDTSAISHQRLLSQRQHLHGCSAGSTMQEWQRSARLRTSQLTGALQHSSAQHSNGLSLAAGTSQHHMNTF
jgi:hypothetical protein